MVNILMLIAVTTGVTLIGGGIGYLIWLRTRPKKETWNAKVYLLGEGVREEKISNKGQSTVLRLQDLKPYAKDVLEKIEKDPGITIYRLQKLNKVTPAVEGDVVDYWGKGKREVSVVMHKGGCTLLKKGYDKDIGEMIFEPLPHSRINLIKGEMAIRKERLHKEKDILQAITPWIIAGICMLGMIAIAYIMISGFIETASHMEKATQTMAQVQENVMNNLLGGSSQPTPTPTPTVPLGENVPTIQ